MAGVQCFRGPRVLWASSGPCTRLCVLRWLPSNCTRARGMRGRLSGTDGHGHGRGPDPKMPAMANFFNQKLKSSQ